MSNREGIRGLSSVTNSFKFFRQFLENPSKTGAVAPSSKELANLIADVANLDSVSTLIEFGPGTGVITEEIMQRVSGDTTFFAVEINPKFVELTKKRCPEAIVYESSAENARIHLNEHGKEGCDCIISSLPWATFSDELQDSLLQCILDVLNPGGKLLTFSYYHTLIFPTARRFRKKLNKLFHKVYRTEVVWNNLPPAFIYCAQKV